MTVDQWAAMLNGREYSSELTDAESKQADADRMVIVFGYSDDNIEFRGRIHDEIGCYDGGVLYIHRGGVLQISDECERCKARDLKAQSRCMALDCEWDANGYSWFITPKESIGWRPFDIMEDGEKFCRGVVIPFDQLPEVIL